MRESSVALQPLFAAEDTYVMDEPIDNSWRHSQRSLVKRFSLHHVSVNRALWRLAMLIPFLAFSIFGVIHLLEALIGRSRALLNLENDFSKVDWSFICREGTAGKVDTRGVNPIPCHSHNDYSRSSPLFDALRWGLTSVEADIWRFKDELFVAHDKRQIQHNQTLQEIYLQPLQQFLDERNRATPFTDGSTYGVFDDPDQTLVLLVDFKQADTEAFEVLKQQLQPLRDANYLSYWDGEEMNSRPITVVCSGDAPFDKIAEGTYRDIFYDAPLHALSNAYNVSNSYYASTNFRAAVGQVWLGHLSSHQSATIREQIRRAKAAGLKSRYWSTPAWPVSLRNHVWHVLMKEGADVLNVDDLRAATALYW